MPAPITIHHSPRSRSMRVVWFCEELGLDYRLEPVEMFSDAMKRPEYLAIHPLGKVPAIDDDGFVLWETAAIFEYLAERHGGRELLPARETRTGALAVQWMGYGENPLTVIMGEIASHGTHLPAEMRIPALVERGQEMAPALVRVVERALDDRSHVLGESFSAADITLGFGLSIARYLGFVNDDTPRVRDYCDRLLERPAYLRAVARG